MTAPRWKRVLKGAGILGGTAAVGYSLFTIYKLRQVQQVYADAAVHATPRPKAPGYLPYTPSRDDQLKALQQTPEYDILIVGGGCTGAGVALDAVSRGLKTALVELDDFSSGTSSRSTKLIHGGVRYLQKAIMGFDMEQYKMVKEALAERANLLDIAPHLSKPLPIMLPVYRWWQVPYYWAGIKAYDFVAGRRNVKTSYFLSKDRALELFPMLKQDKLCGAIVYYDGQHNDARMCIAIILTAARLGANVANHVRCVKLVKDQLENGKEVVSGALLKDTITGKEWTVRAKCVVNATGPFTDSLRQMDDPTVKPICQPSSGIHIVLPDYYSPANMGLLDPNTSDGRVIFFLPWEKVTLAGTTDSPCQVTDHPIPQEKEIQFILKEVRGYLDSSVAVRRGDVLSAWAGIRPLVLDPNTKKSTQEIARNHIIHVSDSNLVTIAGGKWTTYRLMAEETVDAAIKACNLHPKQPKCQTMGLILDGGHSWTPTMYIQLVQDFGLENEVAQHLARTYGDRAYKLGRSCKLTGRRWPVVGKRLHEDYPYLEEEVSFAVKEYACTAVDVIARRVRLAFINTQAAVECLPRIVDIMAEELKWTKAQKKANFDEAMDFLNNDMGRAVQAESRNVPINFSVDEINKYLAHFKAMDKEGKGYITLPDIRRTLKEHGEQISDWQLHEILGEVDMNRNGQIDTGEYLQLMSAIKTGAVSASRFARAIQEAEGETVKISVDRSGGGL
ncbi:glycerol-3-phosphate dehydrogenase, mitochondrial-like [Paramacrobiotus metropolitanus]|uniref:glycerol-3-phosphate dehydrogenase, mitochondrial-like n=1 Tax=Paramacrobiotus metropolitanus TaxID=2943436 RepID=UPI0024458B22|nr:glycerol-3-phosphate dehydrogenase, mitochondrial-like [Paramacrobiotus metropolitanus]